MFFKNQLLEGRLLKRYKRFLADIELLDGTPITAHCANPGAMTGVNQPHSRVWVSPANNPKRKLQWDWQLIEVDNALISINTALPNKIAEGAICNDVVAELTGYETLRREVKYGENSRIDLLLSNQGRADCYVEVKNVNLVRSKGIAEFPDSVTSRGAKHLRELMAMVSAGHRAVMLFVIQRDDCTSFKPTGDIDPNYAATLIEAAKNGVEILAYSCSISTKEIHLYRKTPIELDSLA